MNLDSSKLLSRRISFKSAILLFLLICYVAFTFAVFFESVVPSLDRGTTSEDFAVDSTVYIYMADSLREGRNDPWVLGSLLFFPNTTWTPVFISLILHSALLVMLANYAMFIFAVTLLKRAFPISLGTFVGLLLLNPTTTTSLLCVNKEIIDLVVFSIFLYARGKRNRGLLLIALALALMNRYETCIVMIVFLFAMSRLNPLREKRWMTLFLLVGLLNFAMPLLGSQVLEKRFEEAEYAGVIRALDMLQLHYLYFIAVIPKVADNLFGQLPNPQVWKSPSSWLYINFFNNISYAILLLVNLMKRRLTLRSDFIYFGAIGSVLIAQSLVVQPRYFYFVYILLCLEAAQKKSRSSSLAPSPIRQPELQHA